MPKCKNERQYAIDNEIIMKRWNYEKNDSIGLNPAQITAGSHIKAYFTCPDCNNVWFGEIRYVVRYNGGCNICAGEKRRSSWMKQKINNSGVLFLTNPELEREWDYEKNAAIGLDPQMLIAGSRKIANWICPLGHKYMAMISNRALKNTGCKYCAGQAVLEGYNDLATTRPDMLNEWDYEENEKRQITPQMVMRGAHVEVGWICPAGHKYVKEIHTRSQGQGCPICSKESQTSFPEQAIFFYISKVFPDTINRYGNPEIDIFIPSLNVGIEYDGEYSHKDKIDSEKKKDDIIASRGIFLIRVKETKKEFEDISNVIYCKPNTSNTFLEEVIVKIQTRINDKYNMTVDFDANITRDRIAIEEQYVVSIKKNSIVAFYPELISEWDYEKNGLINPEYVAHGSSHDYYWKCSEGHSFIRSPKKRGLGYGCPICQDYRCIKGQNDFCSKYPQYANLWDYSKNQVEPNAIKYTDNFIHWWKCDKGHSYQTTISKIVKYEGCIVCNGDLSVLVRGVNDFATVHPELAMEWDYEKNTDYPSDYLAQSNKVVFWKCSKCGMGWKSRIAKRPNCPNCKKLNVYDIGSAELINTYDTIAELCREMSFDYDKYQRHITLVCKRQKKAFDGRYIIRYRQDDEFCNTTIEERIKKINEYLGDSDLSDK